jgi:creatinine amidohydrolase
LRGMRYILLLIILGIISCHHPEKVLYEELTPKEFSARMTLCPVAYLPLGTLEWHGEHLPLGSDGIQSQEFFKLLAKKTGGIVLPMLFLGPAGRETVLNGVELYGMDMGSTSKGEKFQYSPRQLAGSAYRVPDSTFADILNNVMKQLSRAGFKIVIAHGHGPSTNFLGKHIQEYKEKYNLVVMSCWGKDSADLCLQCDHAAANETSIVMQVRPELVQMKNLPADTSIWPLGIAGKDPRIFASSEFGKEIIEFEIRKMSMVINSELSRLKIHNPRSPDWKLVN